MISKLLFSVLILASFTLQADDILFRAKKQHLDPINPSGVSHVQLKTKKPKESHDFVSNGNIIEVKKAGKYELFSAVNVKNITQESVTCIIKIYGHGPTTFFLDNLVLAKDVKPGAIVESHSKFTFGFLKEGDKLEVYNGSISHPVEIVPVGKGKTKRDAIKLTFRRIGN